MEVIFLLAKRAIAGSSSQTLGLIIVGLMSSGFSHFSHGPANVARRIRAHVTIYRSVVRLSANRNATLGAVAC